jgi:hypothetical protein
VSPRKRGPARLRSVTCVHCGATFETRHSQGKYCSPACRRDGERQSWRAYGERNREDRRAYHHAHYDRTREQILARTAAYARSEAGKRASRISAERQKAKAPEKIAARQAVQVAIAAGRLVKQPCATCGAGKVQAHHRDYSKPLEVVWLCVPCHNAEHRRLRGREDSPVGIIMEDGTAREASAATETALVGAGA